MGGKDDIKDPRFVITHGGDAEYSLIPRSSDGQLMFLVNKLAKMKHGTPLGSRIAEVHNGSSLFTGDAGQGESNIRRWIIENDWLEAIIALPLNMFYNTGIATYVWVLTNRKPDHRKGKVQLIDATEMYQPLRKNLGKKNCEFSEEHIKRICEMFLAFEENEQSKIFPNAAFGYWKITVERPLRLATHVTPEALIAFKKAAGEKLHKPAELLAGIARGSAPHMDFNIARQRFESALKKMDIKLKASDLKAIYAAFTTEDETAEPVIRKKTKEGVEYEPAPELRDTEQVPLLEEGGIEAFFEREVLPHMPDAWIDESKTQVGYEISFTRCFYKPQPLRTLEEIKTDLYALEAEAEGLLEQIVGGKPA
jgi:type I restriction enzyme M protein